MIKYWLRLIALPQDRLVSKCYWALLRDLNTQDSWICSIKNIIDSSGLSYIWSEQNFLHELDPPSVTHLATNILKSLEHQFIQNAISETNQQNKLHLFRSIAQSLKPAPYLTVLDNREERSLFSNLRLGTFKLEIETGRHNKIESDKRFCKLCNSNKIGNECHFLFDCPALTETRKQPLENIYKLHPHLSSLQTEDKVKFLFFNEQLDKATLFAASSLLKDLFHSRQTLLNSS